MLRFPFKLPSAYYTPIPKIIHSAYLQNVSSADGGITDKAATLLSRSSTIQQIYPLMPHPIQRAILSFQQLNPHYQYRFMGSLEAMREDISEFESVQVLDAFDTLTPLAYKVDLWRLVVMFHFGGNERKGV